MFAANLPVVTVNIPEPGWSLDLPLSATAVTTAVGCRFVAGHAVFTWKWIWKAAGLGRHTIPLNKTPERPVQRVAVWEGVQSYCCGPGRSGRKHRRKRAKDILKHTPFDIDRNVARNAIGYVLMLTVSGASQIQHFPSCHVKGSCVDRRPSFIRRGDSWSIRPQEERDGGIPRDAQIKWRRGILQLLMKVFGCQNGRNIEFIWQFIMHHMITLMTLKSTTVYTDYSLTHRLCVGSTLMFYCLLQALSPSSSSSYGAYGFTGQSCGFFIPVPPRLDSERMTRFQFPDAKC